MYLIMEQAWLPPRCDSITVYGLLAQSPTRGLQDVHFLIIVDRLILNPKY